jgi:hypothetical protein
MPIVFRRARSDCTSSGDEDTAADQMWGEMEALQADSGGLEMEYDIDADGSLHFVQDRSSRARFRYTRDDAATYRLGVIFASVRNSFATERENAAPGFPHPVRLVRAVQREVTTERRLHERELWRQRRFVAPRAPRGPPRETRRAARFYPRQ